jgi:hypothetical protein
MYFRPEGSLTGRPEDGNPLGESELETDRAAGLYQTALSGSAAASVMGTACMRTGI